jgi:uncharacterized membrane protein
MTNWIKAMNPTTPLATEGDALAAARASAVGILIGAVNQAVTGWYSTTPEAAAAAARMVEQLTGQAPEPAALAQQAQMGLYFTGGLVLLHLILAFVQWKKPNIALPIVFLLLVLWGFAGSVMALTIPALGGVQPMWLTLFTLVTMLVAGLLHIAGIRGARQLSKLQFEAANR